MKARAGFGRPINTNMFQSLQTGFSSQKNQTNFEDSSLRYKDSNDWRDWSALERIGNSCSDISPELREASRNWNVSSQASGKLGELSSLGSSRGLICICGHPVILHAESGLCRSGAIVCACPKSRPALLVDDIRFFLRVTKGPHEAHALVMGLSTLEEKGGQAVKQIDWRCEYKSCGGVMGVNPARFRNSSTLALGMTVRDLNRLICEPCLFRELNGGYN